MQNNMNWIITSSFMFISSIIYYSFVRKAQQNKIDNRSYVFVNAFIPLLFLFAFSIFQKNTILINPLFIGIIFFQAFFLSYIGSIAGYIAIGKAPNAGYSLVIQKSYSIYTSIAAVFLFDSVLSFRKFIAILIILICTAILSISRGKKINTANYSWVIYSFLAFFCFGTSSLINKYVFSQGVPSSVILFWIMLFVSLFAFIDLLKNKKEIPVTILKNNWLLLFIMGFSVTFFYYFKQISEVTAPNIGYVGAINVASNAFFTILVALVFKDVLSWRKLLAVLGVTVGLILLVI